MAAREETPESIYISSIDIALAHISDKTDRENLLNIRDFKSAENNNVAINFELLHEFIRPSTNIVICDGENLSMNRGIFGLCALINPHINISRGFRFSEHMSSLLPSHDIIHDSRNTKIICIEYTQDKRCHVERSPNSEHCLILSVPYSTGLDDFFAVIIYHMAKQLKKTVSILTGDSYSFSRYQYDRCIITCIYQCRMQLSWCVLFETINNLTYPEDIVTIFYVDSINDINKCKKITQENKHMSYSFNHGSGEITPDEFRNIINFFTNLRLCNYYNGQNMSNQSTSLRRLQCINEIKKHSREYDDGQPRRHRPQTTKVYKETQRSAYVDLDRTEQSKGEQADDEDYFSKLLKDVQKESKK